MAPVARRLVDAYRVFEPFQRKSGADPLTVARHVADLHDVVNRCTPGWRPALVGASWGAMLALAYAAVHPSASGPIVLIGCGTFDLGARAASKRIITERTNDSVRENLERAAALAEDAALKATAEALTPVYAYDLIALPHAGDEIDARAHRETWDNMLRLQRDGLYPAAFTAIKAPVLMVHGTFDPHPGRLIRESLVPVLPQLEYRELERCGHYPWLERAAADAFFSLIRVWLDRHAAAFRP
jgi:pimeloyl-ACP methyl ester carboxylesterase